MIITSVLRARHIQNAHRYGDRTLYNSLLLNVFCNQSFMQVPGWVWLACAFSHFMAHTLDGIDGKQARRTGSSGPLGELFDHGCDSWTALLVPFCIYSIFGKSDFSADPFHFLYIFWTIFLTFYLSHWEKYNTGVLYLPWSYDITQITLFVMYLLTYQYSFMYWKFNILGVSSGKFFEYVSHCK